MLPKNLSGCFNPSFGGLGRLYYGWLTRMDLKMPLTASDTAAIYTMAEGCPFTDGRVVYAARALYNRITRKHIVFSNNCGNNTIASRKAELMMIKDKPTELEGIKIFPNPTTGAVNIQLPTSGKWQITATDIEGRIIWQQECNGCKGIIKHNLNGSKGLYFIKIINATTGQQSVKKITLQ